MPSGDSGYCPRDHGCSLPKGHKGDCRLTASNCQCEDCEPKSGHLTWVIKVYAGWSASWEASCSCGWKHSSTCPQRTQAVAIATEHELEAAAS